MSTSAEGLPSLVGDQPPAKFHRTRILAGFMHPDQAVRTVRWDQGPEAQAELRRQLEARCEAVGRREAFEPEGVIVPGDRELLDQAAARQDVQTAFKRDRWSLEWVDLRKIVAVQREIVADGLDRRVRAACADQAALLELCIPSAPEGAEVDFNVDPDRHGMTLVSANPNLRLTGLRHQTGAVVIGFAVSTGHLTVARYRGRLYLRNGYHRAAGLAREGVTRVPAVVTQAESLENIVVGDGGFGGEIAAWRVPPVVTDFWDETVSIDSARPIRRNGYHIRADEIRLPG